MAQYSELCTAILNNVGGGANVKTALHCMTRLRLNCVDKDQINVDEIKKIKGVLGAQFAGEQFQVIIGQHVSNVYPEFCKMAGISEGAAIDENLDEKKPFSIKELPARMMDYISGSVATMIPIMIGTGFFKLFYTLFGPDMFGIFANEDPIMQSIYLIGNAGFYFMPVFAAYGAAKKLNTSIPLALLLGVMLVDPTWIDIVANFGETGFSFYGVFPAVLNTYSQSVIPSLLTIYLLSIVYKYVDSIIPSAVKIVCVPFLTLAIVTPAMFCLLAPVGNWIGMGLSSIIAALYDVAGPLAVAFIGAFWMFMVASGMHVAVIQIAILNITTLGYDPVILAGSNIANMALMGVALAYFIRSKGDQKAAAGANAVTLLVGGISEPTLFGLLLVNKRAMIAEIVSGFIAGLIAGIMHAAIFIPASVSNFMCMLAYIGGTTTQTIAGLGCCILAFGLALIVGLVLGFGNEPVDLKNFRGRKERKMAKA